MTANLTQRTSNFSLLMGLALLLTGMTQGDIAIAQSIVPAADGTGTIVTVDGQRFDIEGGSLSGDGSNLFHSFETLNLSSGETANFLANPSVQNILTRIGSGSPSVIDGLLQITGSQANLYLLNPSGVLFGANATLNLPASLTVTTADGIAFGQGWFSAVGNSDYAALVGKPQGYAFLNNQPGAVVNAGNLALLEGQSLTLMGGTVVNTGTISSPGGDITIAAVPGENLVRLSQDGQLLNLEAVGTITPESDLSVAGLNTSTFTPSTLPTILANSPLDHATGLIAHADGTVSLTESGATIPTQSGVAIVAGTLDIVNRGENSDQSPQIGGNATILGSQVGLLSAHIDASGENGGGTIRLGGDYQGQGAIPNALSTFISQDSTIVANAIQSGDGGRVIVWADDTTQYFGQISATGGQTSGDGGFVEISGKEDLVLQGTVDVGAMQGAVGTLLIDPDNILIVDGDAGADDAEIADNQILFGEGTGTFTLSEVALEQLAGNATVELQATNGITIEDLSDDTLKFKGGTGSVTFTADADSDGVGDFVMLDADDKIRTPGRALTITGVNLTLGNLDTNSPTNGGSITLQASGNITADMIDTHSSLGTGGAVNLTANGNITAGTIQTDGPLASGDVNVTSTNGSITTDNILTEAPNGQNANVTLSAQGTLTTGIITAANINISNNITEHVTPQGHPWQGGSPRSPRRRESNRQGSNSDSDRGLRGGSQGVNRVALSSANASAALSEVEFQRTQDFSNYFGRNLEAKQLTPIEIQQLLVNVQQETGNQSAIVYVNPPSAGAEALKQESSRGLELLVFTAEGKPVSLLIPDVGRDEFFQTIEQFNRSILTSFRRGSSSYLTPAQQLYQWLIAPIEDELGDELGLNDINTLLFSMDSGLRSLPIAALHDGQQFLIEKYSVGMVPSLGLMDTEYQALENAQVLAMGASSFDSLQPLPAVPLEVETINNLWLGKMFLNETFTRQNLIQQQQQTPHQIIHLATHAEFNAGTAENSYIQLWDDKIRLNEVHTLGWNQPAVDLLVLSACQTATGNLEAEMGFAGLAVASGVRTAVASLWSVSDAGTLALMSNFYDQLRTSPVKSEALRSAQLAMLDGETHIEDGQLVRGRTRGALFLPPELRTVDNIDLSHPYYWAGFTMIGSPW